MRIWMTLACLALVACGKVPEPEPVAAPAVVAAALPTGNPIEGLRVATRVGCKGCHASDGGGKVFMEDESQGLIVAPNLTLRRRLYEDDAALAALLRTGKTHDGHVPWVCRSRCSST